MVNAPRLGLDRHNPCAERNQHLGAITEVGANVEADITWTCEFAVQVQRGPATPSRVWQQAVDGPPRTGGSAVQPYSL